MADRAKLAAAAAAKAVGAAATEVCAEYGEGVDAAALREARAARASPPGPRRPASAPHKNHLLMC